MVRMVIKVVINEIKKANNPITSYNINNMLVYFDDKKLTPRVQIPKRSTQGPRVENTRLKNPYKGGKLASGNNLAPPVQDSKTALK